MLERLKATWTAAKLTYKMARSVKGFKVTSLSEVFGGLLGSLEISQFKNYASYLAAGTKKVWALWRGCDACAKVVMDTPWILTKIGGDGTAVKNPQIEKLLMAPNAYESWGEMSYRWVMHMKMTGNAFWIKDQPNFSGDRPKAIYQVNPKRMQLVLSPTMGVTGYIYTAQNGQQIPFEANEVIHFKIPHPDNDYWGLGEVESAEPLFNDAVNRGTWEDKFWKNGASPSGILVCKDQITDQTEWEKAKAKWQKEYGGSDNAGKTAWLTGDWTYQQLGLTAQEMQNIESSKWSVEQIFMQLGVPLSVAGVDSSANFATAGVDDMRFRRYTIKPLLRFLADTVNSDLIAGFNPALMINFQLTGLTDMESISKNVTPLFDRGVLSINELRDMIGLPKKMDDPIFDQHFILATLVPIDLAGIVSSQPGSDGQAAKILERAMQQIKDTHTRLLQDASRP